MIRSVNIRSTKDIVKALLISYPETRDNDSLLTAYIWDMDLKKIEKDSKIISAFDLLKMYARESVLTNAESLRRVRQKLQEDQPALRGKNWIERHKNQDEIKEQLGYKV
jgi:hypothetical protein